ncbi:MAG: sugar-binding domain-containing protein [Polyangiaceae bacterium]
MGYPRPQFRRQDWISLNGRWDFAIDTEAAWSAKEVRWDRSIIVPFAPETAASGVADTGLYRAVWYRLRFRVPRLESDERWLLHFEAVDYQAMVWVDGTLAVEHEGGYTPFGVDITDVLRRGDDEHELVVRAYDDPADLEKPRGKQDWQLDPHSIWYPRTTGIWQTVWLERVPALRLGSVQWTANVERWEIGVDAFVIAPHNRKLRLGVKLWVDDLVIAEDHYTVVAGEVHRRIALSDPGIDDFRNELLWSPWSPKLIEADLELLDEDGRRLDRVESYTALRSFSVQGDRFVLNGRPYPLRLVLDQGYWPDSGMTPRADLELRRDVELAKEMGFNGVRKHQKLELPRYLYWADRLGLLVWEEMPSAYRFTPRSVERLTRQWLEAMRRDASHPCIMAWVPFNESWGVPNLPNNLAERNYVRALYFLTKTQDPTRPVIGNDGWESVATDIIGIHDYDDQPARIARRYFTREVPLLFKHERPGGRALILEGQGDHPIVLSEFGGIALVAGPEGFWGYSVCDTVEAFQARYQALLEVVRSLELLAGFCYTPFADNYQAATGLLTADRTPKIPLEVIARATAGARPIGAEAEPARLTPAPAIMDSLVATDSDDTLIVGGGLPPAS